MLKTVFYLLIQDSWSLRSKYLFFCLVDLENKWIFLLTLLLFCGMKAITGHVFCSHSPYLGSDLMWSVSIYLYHLCVLVSAFCVC